MSTSTRIPPATGQTSTRMAAADRIGCRQHQPGTIPPHPARTNAMNTATQFRAGDGGYIDPNGGGPR
jgi:hypothetical protein